LSRAARGRKPLIGVTSSHLRGWRSWQFQRLAIWRAGGSSVRLTAGYVDDVAAAAARLDGLVIGGGDDISATLYGGKVEPTIRIDPDRDRLEMGLLEALAGSPTPVLGVCRGAQMMALWRHGSLIPDIYDHYPDLPKMRTVLPRKHVLLEPDSRLAALMGGTETRVNSLHHQAVDDPGDGFRVSARDRRGVSQAIEHLGDRFLFGVQWHPEYLPQKRAHQRLYRGLLAAAKGARGA
jgi:putative glutamine amidotransferase